MNILKGIVEDFHKARAFSRMEKENLPKRTQKTVCEKEAFRLRYNFWDEWSGSRFIRRENPTVHMTKSEYLSSEWSKYPRPSYVLNSVCRTNSVTGDWEDFGSVI